MSVIVEVDVIDYATSLRSLAVGLENSGWPVTAEIMRDAADHLAAMTSQRDAAVRERDEARESSGFWGRVAAKFSNDCHEANARTLDVTTRLARVESLALEAVTIGLYLASLECSSSDEERLQQIAGEIGSKP